MLIVLLSVIVVSVVYSVLYITRTRSYRKARNSLRDRIINVFRVN